MLGEQIGMNSAVADQCVARQLRKTVFRKYVLATLVVALAGCAGDSGNRAPVNDLSAQGHATAGRKHLSLLQAHSRTVHRGHAMPLRGKPDPVSSLTVTGHQHLAGRQQAIRLVMQKSVGLGAVLEAWLGKALVPKIHARQVFKWFIAACGG